MIPNSRNAAPPASGLFSNTYQRKSRQRRKSPQTPKKVGRLGPSRRAVVIAGRDEAGGVFGSGTPSSGGCFNIYSIANHDG